MPLCLNPAVGTGFGLARKGSRIRHFVMFTLSYKGRATCGGAPRRRKGLDKTIRTVIGRRGA